MAEEDGAGVFSELGLDLTAVEAKLVSYLAPAAS